VFAFATVSGRAYFETVRVSRTGTPVALTIDMSKRNKSHESNVRGAEPHMPGDSTGANADRERIAQRAYELYLARGSSDGHAEEDWLSAEREVVNGGRSRQER
jgi:Protein of unknown function (DUF2934)